MPDENPILEALSWVFGSGTEDERPIDPDTGNYEDKDDY